MKPQKAYNFNFVNKSKLNIFLLFFLLFQISIFTIAFFKIQIPLAILNFGINYTGIPNNLKINKVDYKFPNKFFIEKCIFSHKTGDLSFNNINFTVDSFFEKIKINNLSIDKINVISSDYNLVLTDVSGYKIQEELFTKLTIESKFLKSKLIGILNINNLLDQSSKFFENKAKYKSSIIDNFIREYIPKSVPQNKPFFLTFLSNKNDVQLNIKQVNKQNEIINGFSGFIKLNNSDLQISKLKAKANNISLFNSSNFTKFNDIEFSYLNSDFLHNLKIAHESKLQINSTQTKGLFNGVIPEITIQSYYNNDNFYLNFFSNSNCTKLSNSIIVHRTNIKEITGFNNIKPNELNLNLRAYGTDYKFMDGELLKINILKNLNNISSSLANIKVQATDFSVLETPYADYNASGILKKDLSINFNKVNCLMGETIVEGSYFQNWKPYEYEFILNGKLLPTNINNWFGNWWDRIWQDFKFDATNPPHGNFIIAGDWMENSEQLTFGIINSKNFIYKNFLITNSNLQISIDSNSTLIENINLHHTNGIINGSLSINRIKQSTHKNFHYTLHGTLPVNNCKEVFGSTIQTVLDNFNLSSVSINSRGQIPLESNDVNVTSSEYNFYTIDLFTDQNGTWNNLEFEGFKGNITSDFNTTKFNFPSIDFANGKVSFQLSFNNIIKSVTLSLDLINANIKKIYSSFLKFQNKFGKNMVDSPEPDFMSNSGTLDFQLNANGSFNDLSSFKGSGKITAFDKELSKLQLLGFLSQGLSDLPIPLPSGTLNFNKLEGLFELNHDELMFDHIVLSGLISKIENRGSFNFINGELDITSKIQLLGNLPIPILKQFAQLTDPLSTFIEINTTGPWSEPIRKISIKPLN